MTWTCCTCHATIRIQHHRLGQCDLDTEELL